MINSKNGETVIQGTGSEILADISAIVHSVKESFEKKQSGDMVSELIMDAVAVGLLEDEERDAIAAEMIKETRDFMDDINKRLDDIEKGLGMYE